MMSYVMNRIEARCSGSDGLQGKPLSQDSMVGVAIPTTILAAMTLAQDTDEPSRRLQHLREAIHLGLHQWLPERRARKVAWWDEVETRPLLLAIYAFAHQAAIMGFRDDTALCVKQLLKMDPADRLGAEELGQAVGLFPAEALEAAASLRM